MQNVTSKPVRVSETAYTTLVSIARQAGLSLTEAVDLAVDALERRIFFEEFNAAYSRMREDGSIDDFNKEMSIWDETLKDGLENS